MTRTGGRGIPTLDGVETAVAAARPAPIKGKKKSPHTWKDWRSRGPHRESEVAQAASGNGPCGESRAPPWKSKPRGV